MRVLLILLALGCTIGTAAQSLKPSDLKPLEGGRWTGGLTYLDYRSGKPVTIRCDLLVGRKDPRTWSFSYEYPDEPKANSTADVSLSADGSTYDGETVTERGKAAGGLLRFITSKRGTDNDKPATFRYTYLLGLRSFSVKKEVRIDGTENWFERNTYSWTK